MIPERKQLFIISEQLFRKTVKNPGSPSRRVYEPEAQRTRLLILE